MTNKQKVLRKYPQAYAGKVGYYWYVLVPDKRGPKNGPLSWAETAVTAWALAATHVKSM